jgi:hypothetical protein
MSSLSHTVDIFAKTLSLPNINSHSLISRTKVPAKTVCSVLPCSFERSARLEIRPVPRGGQSQNCDLGETIEAYRYSRPSNASGNEDACLR